MYHTRLITSCSTLNQHLFSRNIKAHPNCTNCICGAVEDTNRFLLECNLFQNLRQEIALNTLLFGNPDLRNDAIEYLLRCTVFRLKNKAFPGTLINTFKYKFFNITRGYQKVLSLTWKEPEIWIYSALLFNVVPFQLHTLVPSSFPVINTRSVEVNILVP